MKSGVRTEGTVNLEFAPRTDGMFTLEGPVTKVEPMRNPKITRSTY